MSTKAQDNFNKLVLKALESMSVTRGLPKDILQTFDPSLFMILIFL